MDRLGSTIAETNASGAVLNKFAYSPFGETPSLLEPSSDSQGSAMTLRSGSITTKQGIMLLRSDSFLQPDPLGYAAGDMNLYSYVGNDAVNQIDSLGLCPGTGDDMREGGGFSLSSGNAPSLPSFENGYGPLRYIPAETQFITDMLPGTPFLTDAPISDTVINVHCNQNDISSTRGMCTPVDLSNVNFTPLTVLNGCGSAYNCMGPQNSQAAVMPSRMEFAYLDIRRMCFPGVL